MNSTSYKAAGFAAIVLAILFPVYWLYAFDSFSAKSFAVAFQEDLTTLNAWDALFIVIGVLEIAVYVAFAQLCKNQLNGNLPAILLMIMALLVSLFHATIFVDVGVALGVVPVSNALIKITAIFAILCLFAYAIVAFVFAIAMLVRFTQLAVPLRVFSIGLLIACVFQFSIVLAIIDIFLFPVLMVVLAIQFLRGEQQVEVV